MLRRKLFYSLNCLGFGLLSKLMVLQIACEAFVTYRRHGKIHCDLGWRTSRTMIFSRYHPLPGHDSLWPTTTRLMLPRLTASSMNTSDCNQYNNCGLFSTIALPKHELLLQGVSVAASPVLATIGMSVCPSVCPSVCLSVTRWH